MMIFLIILFFLFIGVSLLSIIWKLIKGMAEIGWFGMINTYKYYKVDKPMQESGLLEKKRMEESLKEAEKQNWHKEQILSHNNRILEAALSKVRDLRIRYPYADENLFQTLLTKFKSMSVSEINDMEIKIRESHFQNEVKNTLKPIEEKVYTLNDINGLEWLEEHREDPILLRIYKIDSDYLLHVKDIDTNGQQLFQSKDYLAMARVVVKVIEKQKQLKVAKQSIIAKDIEALYNSVVDSTRSFRINRM